jgi:hypothetical protein
MLVQKSTRIFNTEGAEVLTGHMIEEEGFACVRVKEGSRVVVRKSTGAAGEVFAGFNLSRNAPTSVLPLVLEGVADGLTITLPRLPITGQILVKLNGTNTTIVAGAPANAGETQLSADTLTLHASNEDAVYSVQMMYEPSVSEARQFTGDAPIGGLASVAMGKTGLIVEGVIGTNMFDASADWSGTTEVVPSLAADGRLTIGGTGEKLSGLCQIVEAPSAGNPFLVVRVSA